MCPLTVKPSFEGVGAGGCQVPLLQFVCLFMGYLKGLSGFFPKCWSYSVEGVDEGG